MSRNHEALPSAYKVEAKRARITGGRRACRRERGTFMGAVGKRWARFSAALVIRLEPSCREALSKRAMLTGRTESDLAREAIDRYLRGGYVLPPVPSPDREGRSGGGVLPVAAVALMLVLGALLCLASVWP